MFADCKRLYYLQSDITLLENNEKIFLIIFWLIKINCTTAVLSVHPNVMCSCLTLQVKQQVSFFTNKANNLANKFFALLNCIERANSTMMFFPNKGISRTQSKRKVKALRTLLLVPRGSVLIPFLFVIYTILLPTCWRRWGQPILQNQRRLNQIQNKSKIPLTIWSLIESAQLKRAWAKIIFPQIFPHKSVSTKK